MKNLLKMSAVLVFATACSSVPSRENVEAKPMCSGKAPLQKYVWTTSFFQGIPQGMELNLASKSNKIRSDMQDKISNNFVLSLLYESSSKQDTVKALKPFEYLLQAGFIQTGPNNFVHCSNMNCEGIKDPVTGKTVLLMGKHGGTDYFNRQATYYAEGVFDPDDSELDHHRRNPDGGHNGTISWYTYRAYNPYISWPFYFDHQPFPGGSFISENYFSVPESAKKDLCLKAGFEENCFGLPQYTYQNQFIPPEKCDIRGMDCNYAFSLQAPYRYQFLMARNGMCASSCISDINSLLKGLKEDPFLKRKWEDAIAKDIFLKLSTSKTKKVEKDWVVTRTEFNPTLFCQYARPNSELLSK